MPEESLKPGIGESRSNKIRTVFAAYNPATIDT